MIRKAAGPVTFADDRAGSQKIDPPPSSPIRPQRSGRSTVDAVVSLPDDELAAFLAQADPPLRRALRCLVPAPIGLEDARTVVACARIEHRRRDGRQAARDELRRLLAELHTIRTTPE